MNPEASRAFPAVTDCQPITEASRRSESAISPLPTMIRVDVGHRTVTTMSSKISVMLAPWPNIRRALSTAPLIVSDVYNTVVVTESPSNWLTRHAGSRSRSCCHRPSGQLGRWNQHARDPHCGLDARNRGVVRTDVELAQSTLTALDRGQLDELPVESPGHERPHATSTGRDRYCLVRVGGLRVLPVHDPCDINTSPGADTPRNTQRDAVHGRILPAR